MVLILLVGLAEFHLLFKIKISKKKNKPFEVCFLMCHKIFSTERVKSDGIRASLSSVKFTVLNYQELKGSIL